MLRPFVVASIAACFLVTATAESFGVDAKLDSFPPIRPDCNVLDRSAAIVKAIVGDEFFSKHMQLWSLELVDTRGAEVTRMVRDGGDGRSRYQVFPEVYYEVSWDIRFLPGYAPQRTGFRMDLNGKLISDPDEIRLPPCAEHPEQCRFSVTTEQAGEIASRLTNTKGRTQAWLAWSEDFHRYVWVAKVVPEGVSCSPMCDCCKMALVDPNTGEALMSGEWKDQYHGWR